MFALQQQSAAAQLNSSAAAVTLRTTHTSKRLYSRSFSRGSTQSNDWSCQQLTAVISVHGWLLVRDRFFGFSMKDDPEFNVLINLAVASCFIANYQETATPVRLHVSFESPLLVAPVKRVLSVKVLARSSELGQPLLELPRLEFSDFCPL